MDRRTVWAILLMMVIAITPALFIKRPPRPAPGTGSATDTTAPAPAAPSGSVAPAGRTPPADTPRPSADTPSPDPAAGPAGARRWAGVGRRRPTPAPTLRRSHPTREWGPRRADAERGDLGSLKPGETRTVSGPLAWVAMQSKYFVTGVLAYDSTGGR